MKILNNRAASFAIMAAIYAFTAVYGIISYLGMTYAFWINLLIADILATTVTFLFSVLFGNASVYDPYWSVQPIVIVAAYSIKAAPLNAAGILPVIAIVIWGVRLTANWAYTFKGMKSQDWRYTMLKAKTGRLYPLVNFFGIHMFPTLVVYACVLPAVFTLVEAPAFNAGSAVFFATALIAVAFQATADIQMHIFRRRGTGGFIRTGVWKYCRHPNYLGEIVMWWSIALAAVCVMPERWYLVVGALVNTLMFVFISVPLADGRQSLKNGFAEYKAETRMLLPIPKKRK